MRVCACVCVCACVSECGMYVYVRVCVCACACVGVWACGRGEGASCTPLVSCVAIVWVGVVSEAWWVRHETVHTLHCLLL